MIIILALLQAKNLNPTIYLPGDYNAKRIIIMCKNWLGQKTTFLEYHDPEYFISIRNLQLCLLYLLVSKMAEDGNVVRVN